jgi:hypothetical protein
MSCKIAEWHATAGEDGHLLIRCGATMQRAAARPNQHILEYRVLLRYFRAPFAHRPAGSRLTSAEM